MLEPEGFYDGDGVYRVRCMPTELGTWTYRTKSNRAELNNKTGSFTCVQPSFGNHGPIRVRNTYHFAYADGTPYYQVGTTCYAWAHQGGALEEQTLATLRKAPFNKLRMCVFPKSYAYNRNEPQHYPFEGEPLKKWDFTRYNPAFFRHFEKRVADLMELGIEADLIVFHPYDRWGFKSMSRAEDDRYLHYLVARLAAFRNVWWSLANEFDLMLKIPSKQMSDWDRFFRIIRDADPYGHPRGNHNCRTWYDHAKPWVTHASIQSSNLAVASELRDKYRKPIVYDECKYEGNIPQGWGNISAREMVHRFWLGAVAGCYVGHGETYLHPQEILWWSKGGVLHGQSPPRIALCRRVMEASPYEEMEPDETLSPGNLTLAKPSACYMVYVAEQRPVTLDLPGSRPYRVEGIDTWSMRIDQIGATAPGRFTFTPPVPRYVLRLTVHDGAGPLPPLAFASGEPTSGKAPLTVRFEGGPDGSRIRWDFGDGHGSIERNPTHTYTEYGVFTATLTVTDREGRTSIANVLVTIDAGADKPLVRAGVETGESQLTFHGAVERTEQGSLRFAAGPPWKWAAVGLDERPLTLLEGLRSFTIAGWAKAESLDIGKGGNRIAFNLNYNRAGFDLVHHRDGRLRLAVNSWPDRVENDSSKGKIRVGEWVFFAVTYDAMAARDNVGWHFGSPDSPATLDRRTTHAAGPTGAGSGTLTIGNYNETIHRHGTDRQFRGTLHGLAIYGSRFGPSGALDLERIRRLQTETNPAR